MDTPSTSGMAGNSEKRNASSLCGEVDSTQTPPTASSSKKRKSLSNYTYDVLFLQGEKSDITIRALDRQWQLHKSLLCRSEYFSGMFSGAWKEANESVIELTLPEDITSDALHIALGSLYKDDVDVTAENVVEVLSAASFLQIDSLISSCVNIMKDSISLSTVCSYFSAATTHGLAEITESCLAFMEWSLELVMSGPEQTGCISTFLKDASIDFMEKILDRPNLVVINEMNLFSCLTRFMLLDSKKSLFSKLKSGTKDLPRLEDYSSDLECLESLVANILESEDGKPFAKLFKLLKVKQLVEPITFRKSSSDELGLITEAIIPQGCLEQAGKDQWIHMVRIQRGLDHGPRKATTSEDVFAENCVRCAFLISDDYFPIPAVIDLSDPIYLGYNVGIALKLLMQQKSNGRLSCRIQRGEISGNKQLVKHTILCRMQAALVTGNMTVHQRFFSEIVEINLGSSAAHKVLELPYEALTSTHLRYVLIGLQVQFVNPL